MNIEWNQLIGPAVVAAVVAGVVAVAGFLINRATLLTMHKEKLATDRELAATKADADSALADRKLTLDRELAEWKRRTELAEQVLADFYKVRDIFHIARNSTRGPADSASRPRGAEDDWVMEAISRPLEWLLQERDFLAKLQAERFQFMAMFGKDAGRPFGQVNSAYIALEMSTRELVSIASENVKSLSLERHHLMILNRKSLMDINEDDLADQVKESIDEAVLKIEALCRSAIENRPTQLG